MYTWIFNPAAFDHAQVRALDYYCALSPAALTTLRTQLAPTHVDCVCNVLHPNQSCMSFYVTDIVPTLLMRAGSVYAPLHLAGYLAHAWRVRPTRPSVERRLVGPFVRSCVFLSAFYAIPMATACYLTIVRNHRTRIRIAGAVGALAVLCESKTRQRSVCAIVWTYVLATVRRETATASWCWASAARSVVFDTVVFAASMTMIFRRIELQNANVMNTLYGYRIICRKSNDNTVEARRAESR